MRLLVICVAALAAYATTSGKVAVKEALVPLAKAFRAVLDRLVNAPYPARTALDIDRLRTENGISEIKAIALTPKP